MTRHPHHGPAAGLVPVPVAVILPAATDPDRTLRRPLARPGGDGLTPSAAGLVLAQYTRHDELVIDLTADPTLTAAAIELDRRISRRITLRERSRLAGAGHHSPRPVSRRASLIVDRAPEGSHRIDDLHRLADWFQARHRVLAPGGVLLLRVDNPVVDGRFTDPATGLVTAARTNGLVYHQHLVAVTARLREPSAQDQSPGAPPNPLIDGRHRRVHVDLYAFRSEDIDD